MPCAEGDETLVAGLPRALVERWAVVIHFLSPVRPYRYAALSQAQRYRRHNPLRARVVCAQLAVRTPRRLGPLGAKVAPSTPAGDCRKFSWTRREPNLDQGRKIVCRK